MKMDAHEIVDGGHRAIKYTRLNGVRPTIYPEGTHLLVCRLTRDKTSEHYSLVQMPWLERPVIYDVRAKPRNIASLTGTKDLQMVCWTVALLWALLIRPGEHHLPCPLKTVGQRPSYHVSRPVSFQS